MSVSSFLPAWSSLVAHSLFSPNSDLGVCLPSVLPQFGAWCFYTPSSPLVWSLVFFLPQFGAWCFATLSSTPLWSSLLAHSPFSGNSEFGGCLLSVVRGFGAPRLSALDPAFWECALPCRAAPVGASPSLYPHRDRREREVPERWRFHSEMALPGHAWAKPMEVFCLSGDFQGLAVIPLRSLQSVPLRSSPGSSCPGSVFGIRRFLSSSELCRLRGIGQSLLTAAPSKPS